MFTDPRLYAAIVDRLTFNGTIIETGTTSYRLPHARAGNAPRADQPRPSGEPARSISSRGCSSPT